MKRMAKISKSGSAPAGPTHYTLGMYEFDLTDGGAPYESNDEMLIAAARLVPGLTVTDGPAPKTNDTAPTPDLLDPHKNPAVDHLSIWASDSAVSAAASNDDAVRKASGELEAVITPNPTVAEILQGMFDAVGSQEIPATATDSAPIPVTPIEPSPPVASVNTKETK